MAPCGLIQVTRYCFVEYLTTFKISGGQEDSLAHQFLQFKTSIVFGNESVPHCCLIQSAQYCSQLLRILVDKRSQWHIAVWYKIHSIVW